VWNSSDCQLCHVCPSWHQWRNFRQPEYWGVFFLQAVGRFNSWSVSVRGTAVAQWLSCCATNRKLDGSIPDGVIGIFHWHPIALWSWGRLSLKQKWVPGAFPGGKNGRCVRLTTWPPVWAIVTQSGNLNFVEPSGHLGPVMGLIYLFNFLPMSVKSKRHFTWRPELIRDHFGELFWDGGGGEFRKKFSEKIVRYA